MPSSEDDNSTSSCRLCLEETGSYEIVRYVREMINYCFGIEVDESDGLSQSLCKKCKDILAKYSTIKTQFIDNQIDLKKRISSSNKLQKSVEISHSESDRSLRKRRIIKKRVISSSSSSDSNVTSSQKLNKKKVKPTRESNGNQPRWEWVMNYDRKFACRLCQTQFNTKTCIEKHLESHDHLMTKYHNIFNNYCTVNIEKSDCKLNLTGAHNSLVYSTDKIIGDGNSKYYVIYTKKGLEPTSPNDNQSSDNYIPVTIHSDLPPKSETSLRTSREMNKGSVDTDECIKIDDSSDESNESLETAKGNHIESDTVDTDYETILRLANACANKYIKRLHYDGRKSVLKEASLQHKVLSIGRKVITPQSYLNSTGLLRYLEIKNLEVEWKPKAPGKEKGVRILSKRKVDIPVDNGWHDINVTDSAVEFDVLRNHLDSTDNISALEFSQVDKVNSSTLEADQVDSENAQVNAAPETMELSSASFVEDNPITQAGEPMNSIRNHNGTVDQDPVNKLLNTNPVSNPKQLPKKLAKSEISLNTKNNNSMFLNENTVIPTNEPDMPKILFAESLAPIKNVENPVSVNNVDSTESFVVRPKIKVKPVSELMDQNRLNTLNTLQQYPSLNTFSQPVSNPLANGNFTHSVSQVIQQEKQSNEPSYIVLNTVEFPNTRTNSPLTYFRNLLQPHLIGLRDLNETKTKDDVCLIRFKVEYKQDTGSVLLCLSLFCFQNTFLIRVEDKNFKVLDTSKITGHWQWAILKMFQDVSAKIRENAQKFAMFEIVDKFVSVLNSMSCVK